MVFENELRKVGKSVKIFFENWSEIPYYPIGSPHLTLCRLAWFCLLFYRLPHALNTPARLGVSIIGQTTTYTCRKNIFNDKKKIKQKIIFFSLKKIGDKKKSEIFFSRKSEKNRKFWRKSFGKSFSKKMKISDFRNFKILRFDFRDFWKFQIFFWNFEKSKFFFSKK